MELQYCGDRRSVVFHSPWIGLFIALDSIKLIHAFIIGLTIFAFGYYQNQIYPKWSYYGAFLISSLTSLTVGYYFVTVPQSGDTFAYFQSAVDLNNAYASGFLDYMRGLYYSSIPAHEGNWHSVFFVKLISPIVLLADQSYWLSGLYLTLINFILSWTALIYLHELLRRKWLLFLSVFLIPTVSIWSGGIFKESIANGLFLVLIALSAHSIHFKSRPNISSLFLLVVCSVVLIQLRFYLFGIWLGFSSCFAWTQWQSRNRSIKWAGLGLLVIFAFFSAQLLHPWLRPSRLPLTLFEIYEQMLKAPSSSAFQISTFQPDYWHLLLSSPLALFTGLYRPLLFEIQSWTWLPFQLERLSLLAFTVLSLWQIKKTQVSELAWLGLFWIATITIALTLATPNFGSLLRYQSAYLPFVLILIGWIPLRKIDGTY